MRSSDRCWRTISRRSTACPACRAIICSTPCSTLATRSPSCIPVTSRAPPIWRSGPRWRPASPPPIRWCPVPASSTARRRSPPPIRPARASSRSSGSCRAMPSARATASCTRFPTSSASCASSPSGPTARTSRRTRPVGIEVPPDMLQARAKVELIAPLPLDAVPALDEDAIARAADLLAKAQCPVIFVGGGALDAAAEVRELAERLGAPVVAYRRGKGVLDDRHPLSHMLPGGHALWRSADVVLAVGTRLQMQLSGWGTDDKLKLIKVDIDRGELDRICAPE